MSTLAAAAGFVDGALLGEDRAFDGVCTDTRSLKSGELFIALIGPNFDGADYLDDAARLGAAGAIVAGEAASKLAKITVDDTRLALGRLGAAWRRQQSALIVGITGSNGKTTLKELTAACLRTSAATLATEGNLNNDIGMPLMLTRIGKEHRYVVLEMGANHAGEIAYLSALAEPDVVAISNAGAAHLEGFGSIAGVASAKGEILCGQHRPGVAVLNADDEYFEFWKQLAAESDILSFGLDDNADVFATGVVSDSGGSEFQLHLPAGTARVRLSLPGAHNVRNACAAAAIATAVGVAAEHIQAGLENVRPVAGRLQPVAGLHGSSLFDDSYNANPLSVAAAAEFLASLGGTGFLVLGDMGELGSDSVRLHREVGAAAKRAGVSHLYATGELSRNVTDEFGDGACWFTSVEELIAALKVEVTAGANVLVKGSRFMRMERVVKGLLANGQRQDSA
jgi:UDP-N-acetylmuramoyl-tripeptide--D-alanyl-D-alanine ligase